MHDILWWTKRRWREKVKKKKIKLLTEYIKKRILGSSGTSVLYIGCMMPKGWGV